MIDQITITSKAGGLLIQFNNYKVILSGNINSKYLLQIISIMRDVTIFKNSTFYYNKLVSVFKAIYQDTPHKIKVMK